jgi:hypothetical protein
MSIKDYEGGIITKNPTTPTGPFQDGVASGVWTMDQAAEYTKQGVWPTAGNISPEQYVDGVFSTYLYEGTGAAQSITNGIDFAGKGGMLWIKDRDATSNNYITDTERSLAYLRTNSSSAEVAHTATYDVTALNSDGFSVGLPNEGVNTNGNSNVSWSFLKKPGFFDVVTYTGNSTSGRGIAHNLGSTPGFVIVKCTSDAEVWRCFHRTFSAGDDVSLNSTAAVAANGHFPTVPDSDNFYVGAGNQVNGTGKTYVAYLFAHDDQSFGDNADESIIKCGSFTQGTTASSPTGNVTVNLGFEPQWLLIKNTTSASDWVIYDAMRGVTALVGGASYPTSNRLRPNTDDVENNTGQISINSTGFTAHGGATTASDVEIYIAIRRPMKTPTAATEVFAIDTRSADDPAFDSGFPVDMALYKSTSGSDTGIGSRLTSGYQQATNLASAESSYSRYVFDYMDGWFLGGLGADPARYSWMFKRAPGFFDVVCYTGTGSQKNESHNLGVTPELMIVKSRSNAGKWSVYESGLGIGTSNGLALNQNSGTDFNNTTLWVQAPTSSVFTVGTNTDTNGSGYTYIAYLFATLAGISKVGSYTGTGSNVDVDCGFTSGARFILIKRAAGIGLTGDWYVYDSVRGIVSGNDPFLLINTTDAENTSTDYIDPLPSGFTVTSSAPTALNNSGDNYIFLAIA